MGLFYLCIQRLNISTKMEVAINPNIYHSAEAYAQQQGLNITSVIEKFLLRFTKTNKTATEEPVPDVVLSLLGAGEPVAEDDINGREAYFKYLEEKYK